MNITKRAALVLIQIDADLVRLTRGTQEPWASGAIELNGTTLVCCPNDGVVAVVENPQDAYNIAASRTGWPTALRCLKTAIEGLLRLRRGDCPCGYYKEVDNELITLLEQWEKSRLC